MDYSFDHVHIICKDFDKMTAYFERVFGAEEVYREDNFHGAPNAVMKLGSARFFLRGVRPEETLGVAAPDAIMGLDHFSLAVDDVHACAATDVIGMDAAHCIGMGRHRSRTPGLAVHGHVTPVEFGPHGAVHQHDVAFGQVGHQIHV